MIQSEFEVLTRDDLEKLKFVLDANGDVAIRVLGGGGGGGGDMYKALYDPQGINGDAFLRSNHTGTQLMSTISNSGDLAVLDLVDTLQIEDRAVEFSKMDSIPTNRILGRSTAGNGDIEAITIPSFKTMISLQNVDNTTDLLKPISIATQNALNQKENSFTKNTAFNKDFGTTAGTVLQGDTNIGLIGTKEVNEAGLADLKMLQYDLASGKYVLIDTPSGGGGSPVMVGVRISSDFTIATGTDNKVALNTIEFGDSALFDIPNNEFIVPEDGRYAMQFTFGLATLGSGHTTFNLAINGSIATSSSGVFIKNTSTLAYNTTLITINATAGDRLSCSCRPFGGTNQVIRAGNNTDDSNEFLFYKIY